MRIMEKKKDKYACFQWIRDVRAEMNRDMENMTPQERSDYINSRCEEEWQNRPRYTLEESREFLKKFLAEPSKPKSSKPAKSAPRRAKAVRKPAARRRAAKSPVHA